MNLPGIDSLPPIPEASIEHMKKASEEMMNKMEPQSEIAPRTPAPIENYLPREQQVAEPEPEVEPEQSLEEQIPASFEETNMGKNMRALREKAERFERERYELARERDDLRRKVEEQQSRKVEAQPAEDDLDIDPDALIEGKHLKKIYNEMKSLKSEVAKYKTQTHEEQVQLKLTTQYPDFDAIVTTDNLRELSQTEPEIANMIRSTSDIYTSAVSAYKMIKKLGIGQTPEKKMAQQNSAKPKPTNAIRPQSGNTPLSRANEFSGDLSSELRMQLYKEMEKARNS